jgi:hypothetical protein
VGVRLVMPVSRTCDIFFNIFCSLLSRMSGYDFRDACEAGDKDKVQTLIKQVITMSLKGSFIFFIQTRWDALISRKRSEKRNKDCPVMATRHK